MQKALQGKQLMTYCLAASTPLLLMAFIFNFSLLFNGQFILWTSQEILGYIIQAEFLAVASGVLIILPLIMQLQNKIVRLLRFLVFAVIAATFAWIAYDIDGIAGMLFYSLLVFITFGGGTLLVFDYFTTQTRAYLTLLRWSLGIFVYVSLQLYFDLDSDIASWKDTPGVIPFGASFFYLLFLFELLIYPPLTYYLERKNSEEMFIAGKIARVERKLAV